MWFFYGTSGRICFHYSHFRSFAGCHQQISLPCCSSGFGYYNFPYPLYDTRCRAYLRVLATTLAQTMGTTDFAYRCWNTTKHGVRKPLAFPYQGDDSQYAYLWHTFGCNHYDHVFACIAYYAPSIGADYWYALDRQRGMRTAYRSLHSPIPTCFRNEEKPF